MKNKNHVGEYYMATPCESCDNYKWLIVQLSPSVIVAKTSTRAMAVELVNRLDVTGDTPVGQEE